MPLLFLMEKGNSVLHKCSFKLKSDIHPLLMRGKVKMEINRKKTWNMLPSLTSYCSPHNRPVIERWVAGARKSDFIQKASKPRRWWTRVPKNHLAWVRIQAPFILEGEGVKSNTYWFPSASGGDVFISSFLQSFTGGPGQDVSCELNKGILA